MGFSHLTYIGPVIVVEKANQEISWYDVSEATKERLREARIELHYLKDPNRYFIPNSGDYGYYLYPKEDHEKGPIELQYYTVNSQLKTFNEDFAEDIKKIREMFNDHVYVKSMILMDVL